LTHQPTSSPLFPYTTLFRSELNTVLLNEQDHALASIKPRYSRNLQGNVANCATEKLKRYGRGFLAFKNVLCLKSDKCENGPITRSEEHTSELQSQSNLVCRL